MSIGCRLITMFWGVEMCSSGGKKTTNPFENPWGAITDVGDAFISEPLKGLGREAKNAVKDVSRETVNLLTDDSLTKKAKAEEEAKKQAELNQKNYEAELKRLDEEKKNTMRRNAQNAAVRMRSGSLGGMNQTLLTGPMGLSADANVFRKSLLGQ